MELIKHSSLLHIMKKKPMIFICILISVVLPLNMSLLSILCFIFYLTGALELLLRLMNNCRRIATDTEMNRLYPIYERVYKKAYKNSPHLSPKIKLYIVDSIEINAFSIGKRTIAITRGALISFSDDKIEAMLAHELGHMANMDSQIKLFCMLLLGPYYLFLFLMVFLLTKLIRLIGNNLISAILNLIAIFLAFVLNISLWIFIVISSGSQKRHEYEADKYAVELELGEPMLAVLYEYYSMQIQDEKKIRDQLTNGPRIAYRIGNLEYELTSDNKRVTLAWKKYTYNHLVK